jgi:hypothetical protein
MAKKSVKKPRNRDAQDATMIQVHASKKHFLNLKNRVGELDERVTRLERVVARVKR